MAYVSKFLSDVNLTDLLTDILKNRTVLSKFKSHSEICSEFGLNSIVSFEECLSKHFDSKDLKVIKILPERNLVMVKGSVPGHKGCVLTIRVSKKSKSSK